ncbi:MAG: hypothetical protein JXN59_04920 [Anaerolineae bacterium]|nr:hypothetical protein [Anaerolineae bacterium]
MAPDTFVTAVTLFFGLVFCLLSWRVLRQAMPLIRVGWDAIDAGVQHPDYRTDSGRRRLISEGGVFLLGGIFRLMVGVFGAGLGLFLVLFALLGRV